MGWLNSPSTTCKSVRQTPHARTCTSTCPGAGSGRGNSASRSGVPTASNTIARIAKAYAHSVCLASGEEVVIARNGKPVARLVALSTLREPRKPGALKGRVWIGDDFDAPLPPDLAGAMGADD